MSRKETLAYFILGAVNIIAGVTNIDWLNYLTKPLLMITLGVLYFQKTKNNLTSQDKIMLAALLFSCFGDTFLMFQGQNPNFFLFGLGSFLLAQISYTTIFRKSRKTAYLKSVPFAIYTVGLLFILWDKIPAAFLGAIILYSFAILMMGIGAVERQSNAKSYQYVLIGAITFIASDSLIAINKFAFKISLSDVWIMATYIIAQYLIVEGVLLGRKKAV
ncbi:lysoplasmalogenase [Emticicia sp. SJ17W-69]|uniref:lysoplasmalogenase n=1 Tax=Emticicia sp. SJ17W-69 TaxID=3421657 RepID=UPI003EC05B12